MNTSPAKQQNPGIVTFTQQGDRAIDRLASELIDHCDGSTASVADILEQVLSAELAATLSESPVTGETGPARQGPDDAARSRLGNDQGSSGGTAPQRWLARRSTHELTPSRGRVGR
ncbi:hypothetical protein [Nocardioides psychrotolerans]|uniref:hypothetical protein n=1 Tax=Nocardioides psychrotolerans TaxID=1005945 RepID=UPI0031379F98